MTTFTDNLLSFGRVLRRSGFEVPVGNVLDLTGALTLVNLAVRDEVFHACRTVLVRRHDQLAAFEKIFDAFWRQHGNPFASPATNTTRDAQAAAASVPMAAAAMHDGELSNEDQVGVEEPTAGGLPIWSDAAALARKDFAEFTAEEVAEARVFIDRLAWIPGERRTRRWIRGRGSRADLRRALSRSLRTGGDVLVIPTRRRRVRLRPLVLLCDVSGSMERYSRMLLHFAHRVAHQHGRLEVFLFSTTLTRVTRQLRIRKLDAAAAAVSDAVPDWSGGTRIGPALQQFHRRWSRRVLHEGPVVLLISDGWDRGDPKVLRDEIARLQRSCHRLIWLNPLIGTLDYAPLTRGLQAALPFVDDFLPARTLTDFKELALHLNAVAADSRRRRLKDS